MVGLPSKNTSTKFKTYMKKVVGTHRHSFVSPKLEERDYYTEIEAQHQEDRSRRERMPLELSVLMCQFNHGRIVFIGPAGSGKTTLLKEIARRIMQKEYLEQMEYVFFLQCTMHQEEDLVTAKDVFFQALLSHMDENEVYEMIQYAKEYPNKVIFILDSLDSLQYDVDQSFEEIEFSEPAGPRKHVGNFLAGRYFPGSKIITSSREHSIKEFTKELRPEKIVALVGLTKESIVKIINSTLPNEEAKELIENLEESPTLLALCSTPGLLFFAMCEMTSENRWLPKTTAGLLAKVLYDIFRPTDSARYNTMRKMERLTSLGTDRRQSLFSKDNLQEVGLTAQEVEGLTIRTPWGSVERLLQGDGTYQFIHASLQESLTALDMAELPRHDFHSKVMSTGRSLSPINEARFAFTRRILYGILLNGENACLLQDLVRAPDIEEKQSILKSNISSFLPISSQKTNSIDTLEILYSIYESGSGLKDIFHSRQGRDFRFRNMPLSLSDIHVIGSNMANCSYIKIVDFQNCSLKDDALKTLDGCLKGMKTKISSFTLHMNPGIGHDGLEAIANICNGCHVNGLCLRACKIMGKEIRILSSSIQKVNNMVLWEDIEAEKEDIFAVISLMARVTRYLALDLWTISDELKNLLQMKLNKLHPTNLKLNIFPDFLLESKGAHRIRAGAKSYITHKPKRQKLCSNTVLEDKLEAFLDQKSESSLEIANLPLLESHAFKLADVLSQKGKVDLLKMRSCITRGFLRHLLLSIQKISNPEISEVDVTSNPEMGMDDCSALAGLIRHCKSRVLNISQCRWDFPKFQSLKQSLEGVQFVRLECNRAFCLNAECVRLLGETVVMCFVKELHLVECNLKTGHLQQLKASLANAELKILNLSYNRDMGNAGFQVIGYLAGKDQIAGLLLVGCETVKENLESFRTSFVQQSAHLTVSSMELLDISYNSSLEDEDFAILADIVQICHTQRLVLSGCQLNPVKLSKLLLSHDNAEFTLPSLNMSYNIGMECTCMGVLGRAISHGYLRDLDMSYCRLEADHLEELLNSMNGSTIETMRLDDRKKTPTDDYLAAIIHLIPGVAKELSLRYKHIDEDHRKRLQEQSPDLNVIL